MKPKGLYEKYNVKRVDGKQDPENAEYFTLRLARGKIHELKALKAYAESCEEEYPELARDLLVKISQYQLIGEVKPELPNWL